MVLDQLRVVTRTLVPPMALLLDLLGLLLSHLIALLSCHKCFKSSMLYECFMNASHSKSKPSIVPVKVRDNLQNVQKQVDNIHVKTDHCHDVLLWRVPIKDHVRVVHNVKTEYDRCDT